LLFLMNFIAMMKIRNPLNPQTYGWMDR